MSSTSGYTPDGVAGFCGTIENDQWLGFIPNTTSLTITATPSNCALGNGVQIAVYSDCNGVPIPNGCNGGSSGGANNPISVMISVIPGQNYFVLVDGYAGDQCDFTLTVTPPNGVNAPPVGPTGPIFGPSSLCSGASGVYSVNPVSGASAYLWSAPPGYLINGEVPPVSTYGPLGSTVTVTMGSSSGSICVEAENSCSAGTTKCRSIAISTPTVTHLTPLVLCAEQAPYTLSWGGIATHSGEYRDTIVLATNCDSILVQQITFKPAITTTLTPVAVCKGDSVVICGESFKFSGLITKICTAASGCDSTIHLPFHVLDPVAHVSAAHMTLDCAHPSITLQNAPSSGIKTWKNAAGEVIGSGDSLVVGLPGTYHLEVLDSLYGVQCHASDSISIGLDLDLPIASATGDTLACHKPQVTLVCQTSTPGVAFSWGGPDGFKSNAQNPLAYIPGNYAVTVTGSNGCSITANANVFLFDTVPSIALTGGFLNCNIQEIIIHADVSPDSTVTSWTGPGGFSSAEINPVVSTPGVYQLLVTDTFSGCQSIRQISISGDYKTPVAGITSNDSIITCLHPALTLNGHSSVPGAQFYWSWPVNVSGAPDTTVTSAGLYTLVVRSTGNGCTSSVSYAVGSNSLAPAVQLTAPDSVNCFHDSVQVVSHATGNLTYHWEGPSGSTYSTASFFTNFPGLYRLTVTDPANGCVTVDSVAVKNNQTPPQVTLVQLINDHNSLGQGAIDIAVTDGIQPFIFLWYYNGLTFSSHENIHNLMAGSYKLVVTGANGCKDTVEYQVHNVVATQEPGTENLWNVFPNPTSQTINIQYKGDQTPDAEIKLLDPTGRVVRVFNQSGSKLTSIDVESLPSGAYALWIKTKDKLVIKLIAVQR